MALMFSPQWLKVEVNPLSPATTLHFIPLPPPLSSNRKESSFIIYFPFLYSEDSNISLVCMRGKCQACVKEFHRTRWTFRRKKNEKRKKNQISRFWFCVSSYTWQLCSLIFCLLGNIKKKSFRIFVDLKTIIKKRDNWRKCERKRKK